MTTSILLLLSLKIRCDAKVRLKGSDAERTCPGVGVITVCAYTEVAVAKRAKVAAVNCMLALIWFLFKRNRRRNRHEDVGQPAVDIREYHRLPDPTTNGTRIDEEKC